MCNNPEEATVRRDILFYTRANFARKQLKTHGAICFQCFGCDGISGGPIHEDSGGARNPQLASVAALWGHDRARSRGVRKAANANRPPSSVSNCVMSPVANQLRFPVGVLLNCDYTTAGSLIRAGNPAVDSSLSLFITSDPLSQIYNGQFVHFKLRLLVIQWD
jgi:hypothetical protein